jgi:hypothetical protein
MFGAQIFLSLYLPPERRVTPSRRAASPRRVIGYNTGVPFDKQNDVFIKTQGGVVIEKKIHIVFYKRQKTMKGLEPGGGQ